MCLFNIILYRKNISNLGCAYNCAPLTNIGFNFGFKILLNRLNIINNQFCKIFWCFIL